MLRHKSTKNWLSISSLACFLAWPGNGHGDPDSPVPAPPALQTAPEPGTEPITVAPIDVQGDRDAARGVASLTGEDSRAPGATRGLDESLFVTAIAIDDHEGETTSTAELLAESMGVAVRSLGGLGSFSSISVRGAASGQTAVLVDGVPLSRIASVSADLGQWAFDSFATIELYRGGVPAELGGAAMGGALNLVTGVGRPPAGNPLLLSAGAGSFGARHLRAQWRDGRSDGSAGYHLSLGYAGARGDFEYFNDNGTNLVSDDDSFVTRQNNDYEQLDAVARYRVNRGPLTIAAGSRSSFKAQGIPGTASVQSDQAALTTFTQLVDLELERQRLAGSPRLVGVASVYSLFEWQRYEDRAGEIGLGTQDRRYRSFSAGAVARGSAAIGTTQSLSLGTEARMDYFTERDALAMDDDSLRSHGWRTGGAVTASDDISLGVDDRWVLQPAIRLDWLRTVPISDRNQPVAGEDALVTRNDVFASPRIAYRVRVAADLAIKGSVGSYFRAPTVVELYGDRGFVVGNPALAAETGVSGDAGLVWAPARLARVAPRWLDRVHVEAAAFVRRSVDTIAFINSAGLAARAQNLGNAIASGLETGLAFRVGRTATVHGNYTWLVTRQDSTVPSFDDKPLPHRPRHQLYGRIDLARRVRGRLGVLWGDLSLTSGNFLDAAGLAPVPARHFFGVGLKFEPVRNILLGMEGKNLTNVQVETIALDPPPRPDLARVPRAVADFFGYPLPGRAFYLTVQWQH